MDSMSDLGIVVESAIVFRVTAVSVCMSRMPDRVACVQVRSTAQRYEGLSQATADDKPRVTRLTDPVSPTPSTDSPKRFRFCCSRLLSR